MHSLLLLVTLLPMGWVAPPRACGGGANAAGARLDCRLLAQTDAPPPVHSHLPPTQSFVAYHNGLVQHDMLIFLHPGANTLEYHREIDRLLLFQDHGHTTNSVYIGLGMFAGAVFTAAHAPKPLRVFLDGRVHFGPAVFDGGGMGLGVGGRGL